MPAKKKTPAWGTHSKDPAKNPAKQGKKKRRGPYQRPKNPTGNESNVVNWHSRTKPADLAKNLKRAEEEVIAARKARMLKALEANMSILSTSLKVAEVSYNLHRQWLTEDPLYAKEVRLLEERVIDFVETHLYLKIKGGDTNAIKFHLSRKARHRGYGDTPVHEVVDTSGALQDTLEDEIPDESLDSIFASVYESTQKKLPRPARGKTIDVPAEEEEAEEVPAVPPQEPTNKSGEEKVADKMEVIVSPRIFVKKRA